MRFAALAFAAVLIAHIQTPQTPAFRSTSDLIVVDAQVIARDGRPVTTLGTADFQVSVDGRPRRVLTAQLVTYDAGDAAAPAKSPTAATTGPPVATPITSPGRVIVLAIDGLSFNVGVSRGVATAAQAFVKRLDARDRVGVFAFPLGPKIDPTLDHAAVTTALDQVSGQRQPPPSSGRYLVRFSDVVDYAAGQRGIVAQYCGNGGLGRATTQIDVDCSTTVGMELASAATYYEGQAAVTLGMLESLCRALSTVPGRKTVVLVSAGLPVSDRPGGRPDVGEWPQRLGKIAAEANVNLYTLYLDTQYLARFSAETRQGTKNLSNLNRDGTLSSQWLEQFTGTAGGAFFKILNENSESSFDRVLRETSSYYLLGVEAIDADRDGRPHPISIKTTARDVTVRGRQLVIVPPR